MKILPLLLVMMTATLPLAAGDFPAIPQWETAGPAQSFNANTLWEHINGAAETFLQYGFQELQTTELTRDGVTVAVGIYEMGSPIDAFGIYRTERPEGPELDDIGTFTTMSPPYQALMIKDRFYVKVDVYDGELNEAVGRSLLEAVAGALPGSDTPPEVLGSLPKQGQVAGSLGYTRESFLGLGDLTRCVSARYDGDIQAFIMLPPDGGTVDDAWNRLAASWKPVPHQGQPVIAKTVPYRGLVGVFQTKSGLIGVAGAEDDAALLAALKRFGLK